ncbi:MAG: M36 family metallopeptidase [Bacteroidota bacterium]
MKKSLLLTGFLICLSICFSWAQKQSTEDIARQHLQDQRAAWQLTEADLSDLVVSDQYFTQHNGVEHVYFIQRHKGIELYNAISGVHVKKDGTPFFATNRFFKNLASAVNTTQPLLRADQAIESAINHLDIQTAEKAQFEQQEDDQTFYFSGGNISASPIVVQLKYQKMSEMEVRLAWDLAINMHSSADYWSLRIDALTGEVLNKGNYTVYCNHDHRHASAAQCHAHESNTNNISNYFNFVMDTLIRGTYNVFPFPVESPVHGERAIVTDVADPVASPFGWHDTDGVEGAEFTITRGNNVHAFEDSQDQNRSQGNEPDGDSLLIFDYLYDASEEPGTFTDFATVQLFYANNYIHDFVYAYGMDESAGAFQQTNYSGAAGAGDYILAQAQDGGGTNNANFATPPDGSSGAMQMFLWNRNSGNLTVDGPGSVAGVYETGAADFGPSIDSIPISGEVVLVDDGSFDATLGCNEIVNDLTGKVAMIDRGGCFFSQKVWNAEMAGAIGAIICNFDGGAFGGMAAGTDDPITIPSVMIDFGDCQSLKQFLGQGLAVSFVEPDLDGPSQVDGTLDNGIIAHEYGHGISNRLTGGPRAAGCLFTDEQMGEGWSDFFTLVTTVSGDDAANRIRTIGAFAAQQNPDASGIRRSPYSPDFAINSQTYHDIIGTGAPHPLGEVWAATLWELYWALVDEYGFDEDIVHGQGGNNIAVQLVMDGMKLQACEPGFLDGRDGILAADEATYGGANRCIIWQVFAKRGLGFEASQGENTNRNDGVESYRTRPDCIKELKIAKEVTPNAAAGDMIEVTLTVTNDKDSMVADVSFYDLLPEGTTFDAFIEVPEGVIASTEGEQVNFRTVNVSSGSSVRVVYQIATDVTRPSIEQFKDDMENEGDNWDVLPLDEEAFLVWELIEEVGADGSTAWIVGSNGDIPQDQVFFLVDPVLVTGDQPTLSFEHSYDTQWGFDGGIVQISTDGFAWETVADKFFRNGYPTRIAYNTISIPRLEGFAGVQREFQTSYLDLSDYMGEEIFVRFRFASNEEVDSYGWAVDNVEIFDMVNYNSEACVTSTEGDMACVTAMERGTIIGTSLPVSTTETFADHNLQLFPNPAQDFAHLTFEGITQENLQVRILSINGQQMSQQIWQAQAGYNYLPLSVANLSSGFYFVEVSGSFGTVVEKLVIE